MQLLVRSAAAVAFLFLLAVPVWSWLSLPDAGLSGWLLAAHSIVFCVCISYGLALVDRGEELARVVPSTGHHWGRRLLEQFALMSLGVGTLLSLVYAPVEKTMGQIQKIFYIHVPSAWVSFLAFAVVFAASSFYLSSRSAAADRLARSSAELGLMFTSLVLITGPIWARPVWGMWWTWDMRLTLTLVTWLFYVGYLMVRAQVIGRERQATLSAVVGILGFVGVPINYMAIRWWRTQHPAPVMGGGEGSGLNPLMARAFLFNLLAFSLLYLAMLLRRLEVARAEDEIEERDARSA